MLHQTLGFPAAFLDAEPPCNHAIAPLDPDLGGRETTGRSIRGFKISANTLFTLSPRTSRDVPSRFRNVTTGSSWRLFAPRKAMEG